jgi:putative transcriptional regulator
LEAFEAKRDLFAELKQAAKDLQAGLGHVVYSPIIAARKRTGLSKSAFADLLGISVETLENWEQRRELPSKAAGIMITRILENPEIDSAFPN